MGCNGWTHVFVSGYMHLCGAMTAIKRAIVKFLISQ